MFWDRASLLTVAIAVFLGHPAGAGEPPAWPPKFYGFCMELPAVRNPSVPAQAGLLRELGFDGAGYSLWHGEELVRNLRALDESRLPIYLMHTAVNVDPEKPAFDARLPETLASLKGRPVTVSVLLRGFPPGDKRGIEPAVKILRELGDLAADSGLRISIYHHLNDWTESLLFALQVVEQVDHPHVGVNFNLCHWLKVDGQRDYRPVLRENADRIFAVTLNGARCDAEGWANGLIQPLDRGDFDNRELLRVLREIGYGGPVGLMCYGIPDDTRDHLQRSINVWKSWQE